jgi:hypothetical protein
MADTVVWEGVPIRSGWLCLMGHWDLDDYLRDSSSDYRAETGGYRWHQSGPS